MKLGGWQKVSFCDFPGKVAAVVFTQGCNFNCPFCHNRQLIPMTADDNKVNEKELWQFLETRRDQLQGLVITGGEPTLQPGLDEFMKRAKSLGYAIKLDSNGSRPTIIQSLLEQELVDFIAMDIKAPWRKYEQLAGRQIKTGLIRESIKVISGNPICCQFRTTWYQELLTKDDLESIKSILPNQASYVIQAYKNILS